MYEVWCACHRVVRSTKTSITMVIQRRAYERPAGMPKFGLYAMYTSDPCKHRGILHIPPGCIGILRCLPIGDRIYRVLYVFCGLAYPKLDRCFAGSSSLHTRVIQIIGRALQTATSQNRVAMRSRLRISSDDGDEKPVRLGSAASKTRHEGTS